MDRRWRLGKEKAGKLGVKLDYERAAGRSHGTWTEYTSLRLENTELSELGGEWGLEGKYERRGGDAWSLLTLHDTIIYADSVDLNLWRVPVRKVSQNVETSRRVPRLSLNVVSIIAL